MLPSLRHYAVLKRISRDCHGATWLVNDRRQPVQQLMYVPNKISCWPRALSRFEILGASPVRLRSGSVALLFPVNISITEIKKHRPRFSCANVRLDAFTGFQLTKITKKPVLLYSSAAVIVIAIFLRPTSAMPEKPAVTATPISECSTELKVGDTLHMSAIKERKLSIDETKFRIHVRGSFGGMTDLVFRRMCDNKMFQVRTWNSKDGLRISAVD